jgi:hypothetical protein
MNLKNTERLQESQERRASERRVSHNRNWRKASFSSHDRRRDCRRSSASSRRNGEGTFYYDIKC